MTAELPTAHKEPQGGRGEGWPHALPRQEEYALGARLADPMDLWTEPSHPGEVGVRHAEQLLMLSILDTMTHSWNVIVLCMPFVCVFLFRRLQCCPTGQFYPGL